MDTRISFQDWLARALTVALAVLAGGAALRADGSEARLTQAPEIEAGFHLLYELKFADARGRFAAWEKAHPEDPLGAASEAAGYLFEEFNAQGVLTSEFFLDDKRLLGGISARPDARRGAAFMAANLRAQKLARTRLGTNPRDPGALFALTIATGMQADYTSIIQRRHLEGLRLVRQAEGHAKALLEVAPDSADAYLALGAANYIIGCLPGYKRFFLVFGGIHGDKPRGMQQLEIAAVRGHYLRPFAKILLALAALREKRVELARSNLQELTVEFPENPLFARELAKIPPSKPVAPSRP